MSHQYRGNYPRDRDPGWHSELQGIAHDEGNWFLTQSDALWKIPLTRDLNLQTNGPDPAKGVFRVKIAALPEGLRPPAYDHFGDLDQARGYLFVPLHDSDGNRTPRMAIFRAKDLSLVAAPLLEQGSAGWVAIRDRGTRLLLYSSNAMIVKGQELVVYSVDVNTLVRDRPRLKRTFADPFVLRDEAGNVLALDHLQGGVFSPQGCLYLVHGYPEYAGGGIHLFDPVTKRRVARSTNGSGPFNFEFHPGKYDREEPEGIDYFPVDSLGLKGIRGELHVILLDNDWAPGDPDDISIKHYDVGP